MGKINFDDTEYAVIVGRNKSGSNFVSVYGKIDDNQIAGLARFLYDVTHFSSTEYDEEEHEDDGYMELDDYEDFDDEEEDDDE